MFRRRKVDPPDAVAAEDPVDDLADDGSSSEAPQDAEQDEVPAGYDRSHGPYDVTEVSRSGAAVAVAPAGWDAEDDVDAAQEPEEDDATETDVPVPRLDLGGLRVALFDGVELRVDVDQESGQVAAVTVVDGASAVQLTAFAAPRREGIWGEVRREIAGGVSGSGGTVDQVVGVFGDELHAMLPGDAATGTKGLVPVRFVGVDGPRWFLRGLFTGPAARDPVAAARLEDAFRGCVVVRGDDPMAPGEALALQMPDAIPEGLAAQGPDGERAPLAPPRRGPEITEIR